MCKKHQCQAKKTTKAFWWHVQWRAEVWGASWVDMVCSLVSVITFTLYQPSWYMTYSIWISKTALKKRLNSKNRNTSL